MSMNPILLHRWRTKRGLTQKQLAARWGKAPQTILRWENGHITIPQYIEVLMAQDAQISELKKQVPAPRKRKAKA